MTNFRQRQTYYGLVNIYTKEFKLFPYPKGNGECTVDFLKKVLKLYPNKRVLIIWDGATYHKGDLVKDFLVQVNKDLPKENFKLTLMRFAPNAPEQNPVEDIWLQGKNFIRRNFTELSSFAKVKKQFFNFLDKNKFYFNKYNWYY